MKIDRNRLKQLTAQEHERFVNEHPRSYELYQQAQKNLLGGVPMNWMVRWAGEFPLFVQDAQGAQDPRAALSGWSWN